MATGGKRWRTTTRPSVWAAAASIWTGLGLGAAGAMLPAGEASAQGVRPSVAQEAASAVKARLISDQAALVPGQTATLAVELAIAPKWNLYWRNAGDSGLPIGVEWTTPAGVRVGEAQWPAPVRKVLEGEILDYIYTDRVTLLFPVAVAAEVAPGTRVTVEAKVDWLVCREACVPGGTTLKIELPVAGASEPSPDAATIRSVRDAMPTPAGSDVQTAWNGLELAVSSPGATKLTFFPYESDDAQPLDMLARGEASADRLTLEYPQTARDADAVRGVLAITRGGTVLHRLIELPPPGRAPGR